MQRAGKRSPAVLRLLARAKAIPCGPRLDLNPLGCSAFEIITWKEYQHLIAFEEFIEYMSLCFVKSSY